ncbi:hypothetical protein PXK01_16135 [Phaeobacter sp. PT47_59]|uniref:hypothetical protein n=1 Tax=Phaeobacter sp. PT47_59 TaxID=3029979 RepID=UPI002380C33A|nr:hypothetical protein [Phaeobacter sp. PT47_59]MDE4175692.1 hypothetical protein [Phaeobacter sp. PT47_59]
MTTDKKQMDKQVTVARDRIISLSDPKALLRFHENVERFQGIDDVQREDLIQLIEERLRSVSPSAATKVFGPKDSEAREFLEQVFLRTCSEFDLSQNQVKNGVKTGGDMIAGRKHVDVYISYKNNDKWRTSLAWLQDTPADVPYLRVEKLQVGSQDKTNREEAVFTVHQVELAEEKYRQMLQAVIYQ